tara:strand:+ start:1651 stop:2226 length:576 start_codon:yes stop_codon:yes gene_type:complete
MALSKIDVANMVTGATPVANGGTGLTSGTSGQFLKFTGSTTLAGAGAGKILQIQTQHNTSNVTQNNSSSLADIFSDTITLSSSSNYIMAIAFINYQQFGNNSGSTPEFELRITDGSNNIKANQQLLDYLKNDSSYNQHGTSLFAYWTPNSTSEQTVKVRANQGNNGRMTIYGSSNGDTDRCSKLTLFELAA